MWKNTKNKTGWDGWQLTFSYVDFGIFGLELAGRCSRRTRWGTSRHRAPRRSYRVRIGVVGLHAAAVSKKIAHKEQRDDNEDHEATTPGGVNESHNIKLYQFTSVSQLYSFRYFFLSDVWSLLWFVSTWVLTLFSMASRRARKWKVGGKNESSFLIALRNRFQIVADEHAKSGN